MMELEIKSSQPPREYLEFRFCKLFRCTPSQLDKEDMGRLDLFAMFDAMEEEQRKIQEKMREQSQRKI